MSTPGSPTFRWSQSTRRWVEHGGRAYVVGETHWRAKLSDADVDVIFELRAAGLSQRQIAEKFDDVPGGISRSTVRDVLNGNTRGVGSADRPCRTR